MNELYGHVCLYYNILNKLLIILDVRPYLERYTHRLEVHGVHFFFSFHFSTFNTFITIVTTIL